MNKLKSLFFAVLFLSIAGSAFATSIPDSIEPNAGGPEIWFQDVYNNATSALSANAVVVWDGDNSTNGLSNWVATTTTADTYIVAGVVWPVAIPAKSSGVIVVRGVVPTTTASPFLGTVKGLACSSSTAGSARSCTTEAANFGVVTKTIASGLANVCVHCNR